MTANFPDSLFATGTLFGLTGERHLTAWKESPRLVSAETGVRGWSFEFFESQEPLLGEIQDRENSFVYPFLLRESGSHFVVVSSNSLLIEIVFRAVGLEAEVFSPSVEVSRLVTELVEAPRSYVMSAVFARVEGYGQSLRSVALYGADVGDAKMFREILPGIHPFRVSLRRVQGLSDALSVGSRGEINFHYRGRRSLREVDSALRFLATEKYIAWERTLALSLR